MTLDEAIKHCEEVTEELNKRICDFDKEYNTSCYVCAKEHRQLSEWLKDYKRLLEQKQAVENVFSEIKTEYNKSTDEENYQAGLYFAIDTIRKNICVKEMSE